jgi:hypothetical protein
MAEAAKIKLTIEIRKSKLRRFFPRVYDVSLISSDGRDVTDQKLYNTISNL